MSSFSHNAIPRVHVAAWLGALASHDGRWAAGSVAPWLCGRMAPALSSVPAPAAPAETALPTQQREGQIWSLSPAPGPSLKPSGLLEIINCERQPLSHSEQCTLNI